MAQIQTILGGDREAGNKDVEEHCYQDTDVGDVRDQQDDEVDGEQGREDAHHPPVDLAAAQAEADIAHVGHEIDGDPGNEHLWRKRVRKPQRTFL